MKNYTISSEKQKDFSAINDLQTKIFGVAMFSKAASLIRSKGFLNLNLSHTIFSGDILVGSLRIYHIKVGTYDAIFLGPLVIDKKYQGAGLGTKLMQTCLAKIIDSKARKEINDKFIFMIGDLEYYKRFGFKIFDTSNIQLLAPVDKNRCLAFELELNATQNITGRVLARNSI